MTANEIASMLADNAEDVCKYLLPNGKRTGHEYEVGDIAGNPGHSCKIHLDGKKAGMWADFAAGKSGDMIGLWMAVRGIGVAEAITQAKEFLGIKEKQYEFTRPVRTASKPQSLPKAEPASKNAIVSKWFEERKISKVALDAYQVMAQGKVVYFPAYHDDVLKLTKIRDLNKSKGDSDYIKCVAGGEKILIGWQAIPKDAREVVICEGEPDMLAWAEAGMPALSIPFGAGSGKKQDWIENEIERLERFDDLYISMDMDREGEIALHEIIDRIGRHRCKVVKLPKKDANECLIAGIDLNKCIEQAETLDPAELHPLSHFLNDVIAAFYPSDDVEPGMKLPWEKTHNNLRFRPGEITEWVGYNGHGKSMLLDHVVVGGVEQGDKFCIASMEMMPAQHLKRLFSQAGGVCTPSMEYIHKINAWFDGHVWLFDVRGTAKALRIIEVFTYARRKYGITQYIIDSLAKCGMAEDDYSAQKNFVDSLCDFAKEHSVHVHLVCHARKGEDEYSSPGKMDVKGTGAITDMADNILSVWRNKKKEDTINLAAFRNETVPEEVTLRADCIVSCQKQRNHDWEKKIALWFDADTHQYRENRGDGAVQYVVEGRPQ